MDQRVRTNDQNGMKHTHSFRLGIENVLVSLCAAAQSPTRNPNATSVVAFSLIELDDGLFDISIDSTRPALLQSPL